MKGPATFHELAAHLHTLLESESYSKTTMKDMEFILDSFTAYMAENDLDEYTPEIGERLVKYCKTDIHVCSSRVTRAKVIVRKLDRLYQGLDGRDALWGDNTSIIDIPANLGELLNTYIFHCMENGNKQTTLHYKKWICGRFLKNLADLGCKQVEAINGELVQSAFLKLGFSRYWKQIGPFLRFLYGKGFLEHDYSKLIQHRKKTAPIQRYTLQRKLLQLRTP